MIEVKNFMETLVWEYINEMLPNFDVCSCERCRADVAAIALNKLPTLYFVSRKGEVYSKLTTWEQQVKADVVSTIVQAAKKVSTRPRHAEAEA